MSNTHLTSISLAQARDATQAILEALRLEAYLFEIEPQDAQWSLNVECAIDRGWGSVTLQVEQEALLASLDNEVVRQDLLTEWHNKLASCKIRAQ